MTKAPKKIMIVAPGMDYIMMFQQEGWVVTPNYEEADYILFTGGADVSPELYGEKNTHSCTSPERDAREQVTFHKAVEDGKKLLGICRGSQFLSVMSGHSMWQDVDRHGIHGTHPARCLLDGNSYDVTSTHHQMIRLDGSTPFELLVAASRSNVKQGGGVVEEQDREEENRDVESVFYPETNALAFQPHPEMTAQGHSCRVLFFKLIAEMFPDEKTN